MSEHGIDADELAIALGIAEELAEEKRNLNDLLDNDIKFHSVDEYDEEIVNQNSSYIRRGSFEEYVQTAINTPGFFRRKTKIINPDEITYHLGHFDLSNFDDFIFKLDEFKEKYVTLSVSDVLGICQAFIGKGFTRGIDNSKSLVHRIVDDLIQINCNDDDSKITTIIFDEGFPGFKMHYKLIRQ